MKLFAVTVAVRYARTSRMLKGERDGKAFFFHVSLKRQNIWRLESPETWEQAWPNGLRTIEIPYDHFG